MMRLIRLVACCLLMISTAQAQKQEIKIGVVLPLSGSTSNYGTEALRGINLAVEKINNAGGVKGRQLELIVLDNAGDPTRTSQQVATLINTEKVSALIGPITSNNSAAAAAVAQPGQTPLILPTATSPYITEIGEYICRICFTDPYQSKILAEFTSKYLHAEKVAIVFEKGSAYSEKLAEFYTLHFTELGGSIVFNEGFSGGGSASTELVDRALEKKPDVLFVPTYYQDAATVVNHVAELGSSVTLLGGDGWESSELFELAGKNITPGHIFISSHFSLEYSKQSDSAFVADFRRLHGEAPNAVSALGFDAVLVLSDALKRATTISRPALQQALVSTSDVAGVTGTIAINEKRNVVKDVYILRALQGEFVLETTISSF